MKILIYALNFAPELVGCAKYNTELAEFLAEQGHEVKIICAPPYYPYWKVQKPFSSWQYHRSKKRTQTAEFISSTGDSSRKQIFSSQAKNAETSSKQRNPQTPPDCISYHNNSKCCKTYEIIRCPIYVPSEPTGLKRLIHLASFALSSFFPLMAQWRFKPDLVFTVAPTLFCSPAAALLSKFCGARSWLHIQDFETDAAFETGILKNQLIKKTALPIEKLILSLFSTLSTISCNMTQKLYSKGICEKQTYLLPNWVDTSKIQKLIKSSNYRSKFNINCESLICLFSGNIGLKQAPEMIIDAAEQLSAYQNIHFVICGDGPQKNTIVEKAKNLQNVTFLDLQPEEHLNELLNMADIHLLPQLAGAADLVMPSKLTGMLASGRPVVASAAPGTEIARAVENRGLITPPGNSAAFATAILKLSENQQLREEYGCNARAYAIKNLDKATILSSFENYIRKGR